MFYMVYIEHYSAETVQRSASDARAAEIYGRLARARVDHGGTRPHADDERLIEPREPESALADAVEFGSEAAFEPVYVVRDER